MWSLTLDGSALKGKINKIAEITQLQSPTFWQVWLFCQTEKKIGSTTTLLVTKILMETNNAGVQQRYTKVERFMNSRVMQIFFKRVRYRKKNSLKIIITIQT